MAKPLIFGKKAPEVAETPALVEHKELLDVENEQPIKQLTLFLNQEAYEQLYQLKMITDRRPHQLLIEAVNDLFRKHGLEPNAIDRRERHNNRQRHKTR